MPDIELRIHLEFPMVRATFADEEVQAPFSFDLDNNILLTLIDHLNDYGPSFREQLMLPVGRQMFEALFPPQVLGLYLSARAAILGKPGARLTIRILSNSAQLLSVPWEFMYDARHGIFPATAVEMPVLRTLGEVHDGAAVEPWRPTRILLAGACPIEEPELAYEEEISTIERLSRDAGASVEVIKDATARSLSAAVAEFRPHIVHLVAHGYCDARSCGVRLDDGDGYTHLVSSERIGEWFARWKPGLVLLNACESGKVNPEEHRNGLPPAILKRGVSAVVAMQYPIPDEAGVLFARRFYETIFAGSDLEAAVQSGRHALLASDGLLQRHFATPLFYLARRRGGLIVQRDTRTARKPLVRPMGRVSPFKYLDAYTREEKTLFFGRDKAIEEVATLIATHRLSVVHGLSGVGKSSLLKAGLAQSIAEGLYHIIDLRLVTDPIGTLENAVEEKITHSGSKACGVNDSSLWKPPLPVKHAESAGAMKRRGSARGESIAQRLRLLQTLSRKTVLLILDQFEEVVTVLDESSRVDFLSTLERLFTDPDLRLRIVLVIREDFLGTLDRFTRWFPTMLANTYRLEPLTADEAREAIEGPLNLLGYHYDRELIPRLIQDLGGGEVDPASLQIAGHLLFEASVEQNEGGLTSRLYEELGGAEGLMERHLDRLDRGLSESQKNALYRILQVFVGRHDTKRPVSRSLLERELREHVGDLDRWLAHLEQFRVIRTVKTGRGGNDPRAAEPDKQVWELSHDVLVRAIRRHAELLGFRTEMARLARLTQALGSLTAILTIIILGIVASFVGTHYGLYFHLVVPHDGTWSYRMVAGQEACRDFGQATPVHERMGRFRGDNVTLWFLPVGTYELTLRDEEAADEAGHDVRFPIEIRGMARTTSKLPARPVIDFQGHQLVYVPGATVRLGYSKLPVTMIPHQHARTTTIDPFYIDRFEVTQAQYRAFLNSPEAEAVGATARITCHTALENNTTEDIPRPDPTTPLSPPNVPPALRSQLPAVFVTAKEAEAYAVWLSRMSDYRYRFRLPTPSEWEYAARGVDGREYPWGDCFTLEACSNLMENDTSDGFPEQAPVGSFPSWCSPFGVCDMAGNVSELTRECPPPVAAGRGEARAGACRTVGRGANYSRLRYDAVAARQLDWPDDFCSNLIGFRLAMDVSEAGAD